MQIGVTPVQRQQFGVAAALDDASGFQCDDGVALADGRQSVGDDDHGAPCRDGGKVGLDDLLALGIERAGGLIQNQDTRVGYQRAGDGEALALAAREVGAALLDGCVIALG